MYICIFIHIYVYASICIYVQMYETWHTQFVSEVRSHIFLCMYTHSCTTTHPFSLSHSLSLALSLSLFICLLHAHTIAHEHAHTHTQTHAHTYTNTLIHAHTLRRSLYHWMGTIATRLQSHASRCVPITKSHSSKKNCTRRKSHTVPSLLNWPRNNAMIHAYLPINN